MGRRQFVEIAGCDFGIDNLQFFSDKAGVTIMSGGLDRICFARNTIDNSSSEVQ